MSISTKDKTAFKVIAKSGRKIVAEYVFANMMEAIKFEIGMREDGYKTKMERIYVWIYINTFLSSGRSFL